MRLVSFIALISCLLLGPAQAALNPPLPAPAPGPGDQHIFYGTVPPAGAFSPVLVFVHGLRGVAQDWFSTEPILGNDMYKFAYSATYRTAFVSLSLDNTPNDETIEDNAAVLAAALPKIAAHYGVSKLTLICHSKGGLDAQLALLEPGLTDLVDMMFMISTPNLGSQLADLMCDPDVTIGEELGLNTPGVCALEVDKVSAFRDQVDPVLQAAGIPMFTMAGNKYEGNPLTEITGEMLNSLTGGSPNDGLVAIEDTKLSYAQDLGEIFGHHFLTRKGSLSFYKLHHKMEDIRNRMSKEFEAVRTDGFGDNANNWIWSMKWYKDQLYVGTGRAVQCVSFVTSDVQDNTAFYPPPESNCPPNYLDLRVAAEIWRYTPGTDTWELAYRSPEDIPIDWDEQGVPTKFTARDVGFRGMAIFTESDGTEALYVSGVSAGSMFDNLPPYEVDGFPPPRILRTADGVNFAPVPNDPGTFMGEIAKETPDGFKLRGFRSLVVYDGRLFATVSDYIGQGIVIESSDPASGNNAWRQVSQDLTDFQAWTLYEYNDFLYVVTGVPNDRTFGYGVYKTDAQGPTPYVFQPVVTEGAYRNPGLRSGNGLSMFEFQGKLYVGTDRPTELIRLDPDDEWELVVGDPRLAPDGIKAPLSGMGTGFANYFNGHFWRMAAHEGRLYLGTWDWALGLRSSLMVFPETAGLTSQLGADIYSTGDGIHWNMLSRSGLGDPFNYGIRTWESTPAGLFVGTARPNGPADVWRSNGLAAAEAGAPIAPPANVDSVPQYVSGISAILSWDPAPGAVRYRVYRSTIRNAPSWLPDNAGANSVLAFVGLQGPWKFVGLTSNEYFTETAPTFFPSLYHVKAEDADANLSSPSNIVGAPSKAVPVTFASVSAKITSLRDRGYLNGPEPHDTMVGLIASADSAAAAQNFNGSRSLLNQLIALIAAERGGTVTPLAADDLTPRVRTMSRNVSLVEQGLILIP